MPSKADSEQKDPHQFVKEVNYRLGQSGPPVLNYQDNGLVEVVSISLDHGADVPLWNSERTHFDEQKVLEHLGKVLSRGARMYNEIADTEFTMSEFD